MLLLLVIYYGPGHVVVIYIQIYFKTKVIDVSYFHTALNDKIGSLDCHRACVMEYQEKFSVVGRLKVPLVHRKEALDL